MKTEIKIFLLFFLLFILLTKNFSGSGNSDAILATIESLVERKTFAIDDSFFKATKDKALIRGHFYGRPPTLPLLSAPAYFILSRFFGLTFVQKPHLGVYTMTLSIVVLSTCLLLVCFYRSLNLTKIKRGPKLLLTAALGLGTPLLVYGTVFNRHTVAAASLFFSFYFLLSSKFNSKNPRRNLFLTGFFASLAASIDNLPPGVFPVLFLIYILADKNLRSSCVYYLIGAFLPLALYGGLLIHITGGIKPINLHPEYFHWPGSPWLTDWVANPSFCVHPDLRSFLIYSFHALFGKRGLFLYTPLLLFSFVFLVKTAIAKNHKFRKEALLILSSFLAGAGLLLLKNNNFGGACYGWRHPISFVPLLFFFTAFFFQKKRPLFLSALFALALFISVFVAGVGLFQPWTRTLLGDFSFLNNMKLIKSLTGREVRAHYFPITVGEKISQYIWVKSGLENKIVVYHHGQPGDLAAVGDYDGDGTDDLAVFRNGKWEIKNKSTRWYGKSGDLPAPLDYDGDGTDNIAIFREGVWMVKDFVWLWHGTGKDTPTPGDYDGDGTDDFAVFRKSCAKWDILDKGAYWYGTRGDQPASADYDGDGTDDLAIFRKGIWVILDPGKYKLVDILYTPTPAPLPGTEIEASTAQQSRPVLVKGRRRYSFGEEDNIPVPGDYDGDGTVQFATFSNGIWRIHVGKMYW